MIQAVVQAILWTTYLLAALAIILTGCLDKEKGTSGVYVFLWFLATVCWIGVGIYVNSPW